MSWRAEETKRGWFAVNGERKVGPCSLGEVSGVVKALNSLRRIRLLRPMTVPGGLGSIGQVVDLPADDAAMIVASRGAEFVPYLPERCV